MTVQWLQKGEALPYIEGQTDDPVPFDIPHVGEVSMDGSAEDWWARGLEAALLGDEFDRLPPAEELSAEGRIAWNDDGLLVALRVRDDTAIEFPGTGQLWAGDCVLVFVADSPGSQNHYEAWVTPGRDPDQQEPRHGFHSRGNALSADKLSVSSARIVTDDGYMMEILLPWENLPDAKPEHDAIVGVQIYVNDRRVPREEGLNQGRQRIVWFPAADAHSNPFSFYPVRLANETESAGIVRVSSADHQEIILRGPPELADRELSIRAGETAIGTVRLQRNERVSEGRFRFPDVAEEGQLGVLAVYDGDTLVGRHRTPGRYAAPGKTKIKYWSADSDRDSAQELEMEQVAVEGWPAQFIHRVELTGLEPGTDYRFQAGADGPEYGFRTMPNDLTQPIRLAVGGDTRHQQDWMETTNRVAMEYVPDLIVWGGDFAYADGQESRIYRWEEWFTANDRTLITDEGRIIPIVMGVGNHEVRGGYYFNTSGYEQTDEWRRRISPFFYQFFTFPGQPGYATLDFGDYLSLVILDSDHTNPIEGEQTQWLERALSERKDVPHVFPVYHVPAYPSHRSYDGAVSVRVRENWVPLFEEHAVQVAFENHDHTYKRTVPIRAGAQHPSGIVYFGDGAWGVGTRTVHDPDETWYLQRAESERHAIIMTLHGPHRHLLVVSETGDVIDEIPEAPRAAGSLD